MEKLLKCIFLLHISNLSVANQEDNVFFKSWCCSRIMFLLQQQTLSCTCVTLQQCVFVIGGACPPVPSQSSYINRQQCDSSFLFFLQYTFITQIQLSNLQAELCRLYMWLNSGRHLLKHYILWCQLNETEPHSQEAKRGKAPVVTVVVY